MFRQPLFFVDHASHPPVPQTVVAHRPDLTLLISFFLCSYGLFQVKDKKLIESDDVSERLSTLDKINQE